MTILGGKPRKLDVRDISLGAVQAPVMIPETFITQWSDYPKYYQGALPTCGAHAGTILKVIQEALEFDIVPDFSPRYLWNEIKKIDGYALEVGTDMRSIFKVLKNEGICDISLAGNDITLPLKEYSSMKITEEMVNDAQPRIISSYAFLEDISIESLRQAIYLNKAVLLLMYVDDGFFGTTTPTFTSKKYGHFVVAVNYNQGGIFVFDSTEKDLTKSIKFIANKYISFVREAGTAVDLNSIEVKKLTEKKQKLQKLVALYQQLLKVVTSLFQKK